MSCQTFFLGCNGADETLIAGRCRNVKKFISREFGAVMLGVGARRISNTKATARSNNDRQIGTMRFMANAAAQWRPAPDATNANRRASARPLKQRA